MGVCNCSMFCCTLLYVHSSIAIILMGKRELIALLNLSSWCLVMVERLFLAVPRGCLQFVIVVFPDHTHLLFLRYIRLESHLLVICLCYFCLGFNLRWIALPEETIKAQTAFNITFELKVNDRFYTWAYDNSYFSAIQSVT